MEGRDEEKKEGRKEGKEEGREDFYTLNNRRQRGAQKAFESRVANHVARLRLVQGGCQPLRQHSHG